MPFVFAKPDPELGMTRGQVTSIIQDSHGFVWLGTQQGLVRFDGYEIVRYSHEPNDHSSLSNSEVNCLLEDADGAIWIGTASGLNRLDPRKGKIKRFMRLEEGTVGSSANLVLRLLQDRRRRLWVGTEKGLARLLADGSFVDVRSESGQSAAAGVSVVSLAEDGEQNLWVGTRQGLYRCAEDGGSGVLTRSDKLPEELCKIIRDLFVDRSGTLWIAAGTRGLWQRRPGVDGFTKIVPRSGSKWIISGEILQRLAQDSLGRLWIGYVSEGLDVMDLKTGLVTHLEHDPLNPESISLENIIALCRDRSGSMWIGTYGRGVNIWNPYARKFRLLRTRPADPASLRPRSVRALLEDRDGQLWVSGYPGLDRIDLRTGLIRHLDMERGIPPAYVLLADRDQPERIIWLGMEGGGDSLCKVDRMANTMLARYRIGEGMANYPGIRALHDDGAGNLWLGTTAGLFRFDKASGRASIVSGPVADAAGFIGQEVIAILAGENGILWLGTPRAGLFRYDTRSGSFKRYASQPGDAGSLSSDHILCLARGDAGSIWIGTMGGGLNLFDPAADRFVHFTTRDGLAGNVVCGILVDDRGRLWISTFSGLSRFDPQAGRFRSYSRADGLQDEEFNINAYHRGRSGTLYFGGIEGVNFFLPAEARENPYVPPVAITSFWLANNQIQPGSEVNGRVILPELIETTKEIVLKPGEKVFGFSFSALDFSMPKKNRFAYKMEGFDRDWNQVQSRRFALYTNLSPGRYRFRVIASNNDGLWNREGASIVIIVKPPFWRTPWFIAFAVLCVLALVYGAHRMRTAAVERRSRQLEAINLELQRQMDERRSAEEALQESEEKYRTLTDNINAGIYRVQPQGRGRFVEVNPAMVQLFGYGSREELLAADVADLYPSAADRRRLMAQMTSKGYAYNRELRLRRRDGTLLWCRITAKAVCDDQGRIVYHDGLIEDISEQKKLESQILQIQKMEAVGQLAGGLAHDFNNILTVVIGQADLMRLTLGETHPLLHPLEDILRSGKHGRDLIAQLLAFSRRQIVEPRLFDINRVVSEMEAMFRRILGEDILIRTVLCPKLPSIKADPVQIETVFMNLVFNARDAIREAEQAGRIGENLITIETDSVVLDENFVALHPGSVIGPHVMMAISDNGIGMSEDVRQKIFEPFFTTKEKEKGTGLGLSAVFGIVKQNKGSIYVYSEPGRGSTFKIFWPVAEEGIPATPLDAVEIETLHGTETILIVEDEESVREFIVMALKSFGYNVIASANGHEALEILKDSVAVDLLFSDLVMPHMGGRELAVKARDIRPGIKILLTSGYADNQIPDGQILEDGVLFIQKPFTLYSLSRKVREALDGA